MYSEFPEKELIDFTRHLIRTPSLTAQEENVARMVADMMTRLGYDEVSIDEKYNVLGTIHGSGEGKSILLNGHTDHVTVGAMPDPYSGDIRDGDSMNYDGKIIWGRGASDMKSGVAAMIMAAGFVKRCGISLKGDVIVLANAQEEPGRGEGILHLLKHTGLRADMAINCEPSDLGIRIGQTGRMDIKITARGIQSHSSYPERGKNAIYEMSRFIEALTSRYSIPEHPVFGRIPYSVVQISSPPIDLPVVPESCEIVLNRRFTHEENRDTVTATFEALIDSIRSKDPDFSADVEYLGEFPPFYCNPEDEIVMVMKEASRNVTRETADIGTWTFGTEAGYLTKHGIPSVGLGPGIPSLAHTDYEFVPVDHVVSASKIYAEAICLINGVSMCSVGK